MKQIISLLFITTILLKSQITSAQGCVAIKGMAGTCSKPSDAKGWEMNINNIMLEPLNKNNVLKKAVMLLTMRLRWILLLPEQ
jgi:hypothetical protein